MPSGVTAPLYDGEPMSFPEFASRAARTVGPWIGYERETPLDVPLPDEFQPGSDEHREKRQREVTAELARVALWSDEEADSQAHRHNLSMLKGHLQIVQSSRKHVRAYEFMSAQVASWQAPTEEHEVMRGVMQNQLDETFGFSLKSVHDAPPEKVSGQEYREIMLRQLARQVQMDQEELDLSHAQVEQASDFAGAFKDSIEGWEDVPVPRRVLP